MTCGSCDAEKAGEGEKARILTKVKCPQCGYEHEVAVEIPETPETPKMMHQG